jgi:hypothetical protein
MVSGFAGTWNAVGNLRSARKHGSSQSSYLFLRDLSILWSAWFVETVVGYFLAPFAIVVLALEPILHGLTKVLSRVFDTQLSIRQTAFILGIIFALSGVSMQTAAVFVVFFSE